MTALESKYEKALKVIKIQIQESELLSQYLEEEDEEIYNQLKDKFEPQIEQLHSDVVSDNPLQIIALEESLFDSELEGLFLPRVLGYAVLRGALSDDYKYVRPQEHFKNVLLAIVNSSNFELLSQRIGQTIEIGFALSSDIWITNLIAEIRNKTVVGFLQLHKLVKYRDIRSRHTAYLKYKNQFRNFNFLTAILPKSASELKIEFKSIRNFLLYRGKAEEDKSESVYNYISGILGDDSLGTSYEHMEILLILGLFFDLKDKEGKGLIKGLNSYISDDDKTKLLEIIKNLQSDNVGLDDSHYQRLANITEKTKQGILSEMLRVINEINSIGYINSDAIEAARTYYNQNKGLSLQNECLRNMIFQKFLAFMSSLDVNDFSEYFELNKIFVVYMNIFSNEKFNQGVKRLSMSYVKKLLKKYTVKRSKDYQDIKKFVSATFVDLGFLNEKEIKELFKTKRKKATA